MSSALAGGFFTTRATRKAPIHTSKTFQIQFSSIPGFVIRMYVTLDIISRYNQHLYLYSIVEKINSDFPYVPELELLKTSTGQCRTLAPQP